MDLTPAELNAELEKFRKIPGEIESLNSRLAESRQKLDELSRTVDLNDRGGIEQISQLKNLVDVLPGRIAQLEASVMPARHELYSLGNNFVRGVLADYCAEMIKRVQAKVGKHIKPYFEESKHTAIIENSIPMLEIRHLLRQIDLGIRTSAVISVYQVSNESVIVRAENFLALWHRLKKFESELS